jgi:hypothetical protein
MSTSARPSFDPRLVEDTRQRIRLLGAEIAKLSRSDLTPDEFYSEFLSRLVTALGAVGAAVWFTGTGDGLTLGHQVNLQQTGLDNDPEAEARHGRLLARVLSDGPMAVLPHSGGEDGRSANPTDFLVMLAPLATELEATGVVEVFQRPEAAPAAPRGQLGFLAEMCGLAGDYVRNRQLRQFSDRQALWTRLEQFACEVHASLDPVATAYTIANDGRRLIECDRLSVAVRRGRRCVIEAISGQDLFERRSNAVRLLEKLCAAAVASGEPIWYHGDAADLPPQIEAVVQQYADQCGVKTLGILPLTPPRPDEEDDTARPGRRPEPIGALVVERIEDSRVPPGMRQRADAVGRHAAAAMLNALEHHELFLLPLWRSLGRMRCVVAARNLPKTLAAAATLAAIGAWLALWPADLELEAKGTLQPVLQRDVFAGIDGRVIGVHVDHRDRVRGPDVRAGNEGTLLADLRNHALEEEVARVSGQRSTVRQQIATINRSLLEERLTVPEQNRLSGDLAELKQRLQDLEIEWNLCLEKQKDLAIRSPADGQVVTWDVRNLLISRPVERGQRLMRIADTDGPWQLELNVPEDRLGHIVRARRQTGDDLRVSFVLATDPGAQYEGKIEEVQAAAEVRGEEGNTVLVKVRIDKAKLPYLMPGAGVSAKIDCGRCAVGYDLLHDVFAWFQRLWFRL